MSELLFLVEAASEGGYTAHANVREAVKCHFEDGQAPKMIRLHEVGKSVDTTVTLTRSI